MRGRGPQRVGLVSDTHGLLRPELVAALEGCALIVHAGDVGRPEVLDALRRVAPVVAVRGNVDRGLWAQQLRRTEVVEVGQALLYVIHDLAELDLDPVAAGFQAVVSGHTHKPGSHEERGVLYINPCSAVPRRLRLPTSAALLLVAEGDLQVEWIE
ncbi:MAG: metallophosphoesterase, partial [Chloroflexi bacterium]